MVVYRVVNPSSATQAGLQRGDRGLRINDDYTRMSYHQACTLWLSGNVLRIPYPRKLGNTLFGPQICVIRENY